MANFLSKQEREKLRESIAENNTCWQTNYIHGDKALALLDHIDALEGRLEELKLSEIRLNYLFDNCTSHYGDGYETPNEYYIQLIWQQGDWIRDGSNGGRGRADIFPGWKAIIDRYIALDKEDEEAEAAIASAPEVK